MSARPGTHSNGRRWAAALVATLLAMGAAILGDAPAATAGGPPPVSVSITVQPTSVRPGGATLVTYVVENNTFGEEAPTAENVTLRIDADSGATFDYDAVTFSDSDGFCQTIEGDTTCNIGNIPPGGQASLQIPLAVAPSTPAGTGVEVFGNALYFFGGEPSSVEAPPITVTVSSTSPPGSASGFVPPGGTLNTGNKPSPGAKDTVVLFKLPRQSTGTAMTITTSPCSPGDCFGHVVTFTPFSGTTDPRHPARIRLRWDPTVAGTGAAGNLYKNADGSPTQVLVPKCVRTRGALTASPCVQNKRVLRNGVVQFVVFLLSGDPSMRRR